MLADPSKGGGGLILAETSAADTLTIDAAISDANASAAATTPGYTDITVAGPGTTVLAGNNSFDGGVTLEAGKLDIEGNAQIGTITFTPTGSSDAPVILSMALPVIPTSIAYQAYDALGALNEFGTFGLYDPIVLPNLTPPASPISGELTANSNNDISSIFGVYGFADPDVVELGSGSNAPVIYSDINGVATLTLIPQVVEIRGLAGGTLTTGDSIEISNAAAPAQPMTLTSFAYNGDTLVAVPLSGDTTGYIDFGTSIAPGTEFTLQAGPGGVATLTLASTTFSVAQSSDFSNALAAVTAATQAGTTPESFLITQSTPEVVLSARTTQLDAGGSLTILGQGNEITTTGDVRSTFDGPGTVLIEDATLDVVYSYTYTAPKSYGLEVGSGTTVDLDQISVEAASLRVDAGGVLNIVSSTVTEGTRRSMTSSTSPAGQPT